MEVGTIVHYIKLKMYYSIKCSRIERYWIEKQLYKQPPAPSEQGRDASINLENIGEAGPFNISHRIEILQYADGGTYLFR